MGLVVIDQRAMSSAEDPAGGDVEVLTPFTEEQVLGFAGIEVGVKSGKIQTLWCPLTWPGLTEEMSVTYYLSDARARYG